MELIWGLLLVALSLLCWGGQTLALFAPALAERLALTDKEAAVEPAFYADGRGEARWDFFTLWTLLAAGVLLIFDSPAWPYFGLIGGAMYVYFAGRGVLTRVEMRRRGLRIGAERDVTMAFVALSVWGVAGLITVVAAAASLSG